MIHQYPELSGIETSGAGFKIEGTVPLLGDVTIVAPAEVRVDCLDSEHGGDYWGTLYATRVSAIHRQ